MTSENARLERYMAPPSSSSESDTSSEQLLIDSRRKKRRRDANVYDAVAGRVTTTNALDDVPVSETPYQRHQRTTLRDPTLAPEEVLFRRAGAPVRYAEKDIYHAHEQLPHGGQGVLPDSDMLKAIHSYSSHFYAALAAADDPDGMATEHARRTIDEQSMDETALLAFGILLEEAGHEILGKKGDLVFTEGVEAGRDEGQLGGTDGTAVGFLGVGVLPKSRRGTERTVASEKTQ